MQETISVTQTYQELEDCKTKWESWSAPEKKVPKTELLYDGIYYDITSWMKKHPGGRIIEMFASTEQDALHAIQQFHYRSTDRVMKIMKALPQRKATGNDWSKLPPSTQNASLTEDFLQLFSELKSEGYFEPAPWHVASRFFDLFLLLSVGHWLYFSSGNPLTNFLGMLIIGLGYGRTAMLGHECGHHSLSGNPHVDRFVLTWLYGLGIGFSGSYWISQHSRHHALPQHLEHDIDVRTLPLMAFNKKIVKKAKDGQTFLIRNQKWLFLFDTFLVAIGWKFYLHPLYSFSKGKYSELVAMLINTVFYFYLYGFVNTFLLIWFAAMYLLGNFTLNHSHFPVTEESMHWVQQTLFHTANIRSSYFGWTDYWMGNLNYQIEHHLFPTMPQFKNKLIRDRVKALAKKHNLPYNLMSYGEAVAKTFNNLDKVSRELN